MKSAETAYKHYERAPMYDQFQIAEKSVIL